MCVCHREDVAVLLYISYIVLTSGITMSICRHIVFALVVALFIWMHIMQRKRQEDNVKSPIKTRFVSNETKGEKKEQSECDRDDEARGLVLCKHDCSEIAARTLGPVNRPV